MRLLLVSPTVNPSAPAWPFRETVPVEGVPPTTDEGFRVTETRDETVMVSVAFIDCPFAVAEIFDVLRELTPIVEMLNVADVVPAATKTVPGTVAAGFELVKLTTRPPGPAAPLKVMVPVELFPPTTDVGTNTRPISAPGFTFKVAL